MFTQTNTVNRSSFSNFCNTLNDPIEVLVHFNHHGLKPLRFLWKNRSYHIDSITSQYHTKDGGINFIHFAAISTSNLYNLVYNPTNHTWRLTQVQTS